MNSIKNNTVNNNNISDIVDNFIEFIKTPNIEDIKHESALRFHAQYGTVCYNEIINNDDDNC